MSCRHGNHEKACDVCDEVDAAYEAGKKSIQDRIARAGDGVPPEPCRYDCAQPEGDYDAGMEPGDGYVPSDDYDALRQQFADLIAKDGDDARRYRWLRQCGNWNSDSERVFNGCRTMQMRFHHDIHLDAAIDAASKGAGE